jgi:hypothetical protein
MTCACGKEDPLFQCRDCLLMDLVCEACCVADHCELPLHIIEVSTKIMILCFVINNFQYRNGMAIFLKRAI